MSNALGQADWLLAAGTWVGLGISLLILSAIAGDHWLARLGNHVLVAAALGYAAVVTWYQLRDLPLVFELRTNPLGNGWNWVPVALAFLLTVAALERILFQGESGPPRGGWRRVVRWLGMGPAALLVSAGMAIIGLGVVQGTLGPQFLHTAQTGVERDAPWGVFLTGVLTMVLTASALIFFVVDPRHHLADQPGWVQRLTRGWIWVGQRAVWLAAGVIFARLVASRISLTLAEFESLRTTIEALWRSIGGA
jgi:hypothetical protein